MSLNGSQTNFGRCLAVSWADTLHIHFLGFLPRCGILPGAKFSLYPPSLALSYIGRVTARHLNSGRKPNFVALSTGHHLYSAGRPSRWALAHILVVFGLVYIMQDSVGCKNLITVWWTVHFCQILQQFHMNQGHKTCEAETGTDWLGISDGSQKQRLHDVVTGIVDWRVYFESLQECEDEVLV